MGYLSALDMSEQVDIHTALSWHLQSNHYPPVPKSMVQPCKEAIDAYWDGDTDIEIELPEGITWRDKTTAPAWAIIEGHHLEPWLTDDLDDEEMSYFS